MRKPYRGRSRFQEWKKSRGKGTRCHHEGRVRSQHRNRNEDRIHSKRSNARNGQSYSESAPNRRNDSARNRTKSLAYQGKRKGCQPKNEKASASKTYEHRNERNRDDRNKLKDPNNCSGRSHATQKSSAIKQGARDCRERNKHDAVATNAETHLNDETSNQRNPSPENDLSHTAPENQQIDHTENDNIEPTPWQFPRFPPYFHLHPPSVNWYRYYVPCCKRNCFPGFVQLPRPKYYVYYYPRRISMIPNF